MIKVNLCPVDELENQYWYLLDVVVAVAVALVAYVGVQQYLDQVRQDVEQVNTKIASLEDSYRQLEPELRHFETLNEDIKKLNTKLGALQGITVSKISKYKPVVVIEHLQNLKPEGVWFESLRYGVESPERFEIKGQAFDNILTAELMTSIRATENQDFDGSDLRTQVFFSKMTLEESAITEVSAFAELADYPTFSIKGDVQERAGSAQPAAAATTVSSAPASTPQRPARL